MWAFAAAVALHAALTLDVSASRQNTGYGDIAVSGTLDSTPPRGYILPQPGTGPAARGLYTRVWVRSRDGSWKVALDVLQPQQ